MPLNTQALNTLPPLNAVAPAPPAAAVLVAEFVRPGRRRPPAWAYQVFVMAPPADTARPTPNPWLGSLSLPPGEPSARRGTSVPVPGTPSPGLGSSER